MSTTNSPLAWYQKTGTLLGVGCGGILVVLCIIVAALAFSYYRQLSSGQGAELQARFGSKDASIATTGFTSSGDRDTRVSVVVDREKLEVGDFPTIGSNKPKITVVEFVDFKCPNCRLAAPILRQLVARYGSMVKIISRNAPFESLHPGATRLAQIAWCSHRQGRYWAVHDYLFAEQDSLPVEFGVQEISYLVTRFGLDAQAFDECMGDQRSIIAVNKDYIQAKDLGVYGTPTFFINGQKVEGVIPFSAWEELLQTKK
jgi:protein-disulfide isomerase